MKIVWFLGLIMCVGNLQAMNDGKGNLVITLGTSHYSDNDDELGFELMPDSPDFPEFVKNAREGNRGALRKTLQTTTPEDKNLALVQAAQKLDYKTCAFLLRHGALTTAYEGGALSGAVQQIVAQKKTDLSLLKLLLDNGARDGLGNICYKLAQRKKRQDILILLAQYTKDTSGE